MEEGGYTFLHLRSKVLYQAIPDFKGNIASIYPKKIEFALYKGELFEEEYEEMLSLSNGRFVLLVISGRVDYGLDEVEGLALVSFAGASFNPHPGSIWAIAPFDGNFALINWLIYFAFGCSNIALFVEIIDKTDFLYLIIW